MLAVAAALAMMVGASIIGLGCLHAYGLASRLAPLDESWSVFGGLLVAFGHLAALIAVALHLTGVRHGDRSQGSRIGRVTRVLPLEASLVIGSTMVALSSLAIVVFALRSLTMGAAEWPSMLTVTLTLVLGVVGLQTAAGGLVLALIDDDAPPSA